MVIILYLSQIKVTQQTIRVPMGYPLPGMQLHVVAGRTAAAAAATTAAGAHQYAQYARHQGAARNFAYPAIEKQPAPPPPPHQLTAKFTERGVPEGAASVTQSDCTKIVSPTAPGQQQPTMQSHPQQQQQQHQQLASSATTTTSTSTTAATAQGGGAVFYAMNV